MPKGTTQLTWKDVTSPEQRGQGMMLSPTVVAEGLGVTQQTVCRMLREGEIKGVRVGGVWRVSRDWLMTFIGLEEK